MKKLVLGIGLLPFFALVISAQSGRRIPPTPTPIPTQAVEVFSESVPQTKRPPRTVPSLRGSGVDNRPNVVPAAGSSGSQPVDVEVSEGTIRIETNLVTIPVSVFDRNGLYIPGLNQSDFKIFEDGVEQEIEYFGTTDKPFSVILLLDTSLSTQYRIEEIRTAAKAFVDQLKPQDRVMVVEFKMRVRVLSEMTGDRQAIYKGIDRADFGDGTSIYDAVDESLRKHFANIEGRKAIVLFTDGVDTTSKRAGYDSTLDLAEEADVMIFPIYYNTYFENRTGGSSVPSSTWPFPQNVPAGAGLSAAEYAVGRKYVEELAAYTGGRVFRPESVPGGLTNAFEGIAEELRRQYNIGYIPKDDGKPGERKTIKVRVARPNLIVRARDSYIVGSNK